MRIILPAWMLLPIMCVVASAANNAANHLKQPDAWFTSDAGQKLTANILAWQTESGGWPKNTDTTAPPKQDVSKLTGTFDNGATTDELRYLARAFNATRDDKCRVAFQKGLALILKAQYPTGGWPQFYPPGKQYHRHITFNDNAMARLMIFLRDVSREKMFAFVDENSRKQCALAFDRGIACILKCQIKVNGQLTAWCAQHDEIDLSPRPARAYELASMSGSESVGLTRLLMSLDAPTPEVILAVESAVKWMEGAKLTGIKLETREDKTAPGGRDRVVVADVNAPPLWARFYDINTNKPIFCDRDGIAKETLAQIGHERRNGYAWLGDWPRRLLETEHPAWRAKLKKL